MRQHALTINASFELTAPPLRTPPDAIGLAAADQSGLRAGGPLAASLWLDGDGAAIKIVAADVASSDFAEG